MGSSLQATHSRVHRQLALKLLFNLHTFTPGIDMCPHQEPIEIQQLSLTKQPGVGFGSRVLVQIGLCSFVRPN